MIFDFLWSHSIPDLEIPGTAIVQMGYRTIAAELRKAHPQYRRLTGRTCRENVEHLIDKQDMELIGCPDPALHIAQTYRLYSDRLIAQRREAAGLKWIIETSGVAFVGQDGLPLLNRTKAKNHRTTKPESFGQIVIPGENVTRALTIAPGPGVNIDPATNITPDAMINPGGQAKVAPGPGRSSTQGNQRLIRNRSCVCDDVSQSHTNEVAVDLGPVIDALAAVEVESHVAAMLAADCVRKIGGTTTQELLMAISELSDDVRNRAKNPIPFLRRCVPDVIMAIRATPPHLPARMKLAQDVALEIVQDAAHDLSNLDLPPEPPNNEWRQILKHLEPMVNSHTYSIWLANTRFGWMDGNTLVVVVPTEDFLHIRERFWQEISDAISRLGLQVTSVRVITKQEFFSSQGKDGGYRLNTGETSKAESDGAHSNAE